MESKPQPHPSHESMDVKWIQRLVQIMRSGEVTELELDEPSSGLHLRLKRGGEPTFQAAPVLAYPPPPAVLAPPVPAPPAPLFTDPASTVAAGAAGAPGKEARGEVFASPMVGTFYRAASPESDPFVGPGSTFRPDSTLCIIEAMKVMNEIKAELSGTILEVLVDNGTAVEFGQPLFTIKKS